VATYGYARVSTRDQTLAAQDAQLHAAGCAKVYSEKISGARSDRPELAKLIRRLAPGDVFLVTRLDRLARSTRDLLNTILGGLAQFERSLIIARTGEGRTRAKARGVIFGRPLTLTAHQQQEAIQRLANGETQADIGRSYNVSHQSIGRLARANGV
jgi:DNA invertase Pin-like site-specific DNA recombinase